MTLFGRSPQNTLENVHLLFDFRVVPKGNFCRLPSYSRVVSGVVVPLGEKNPDFPLSRHDVRPLTTDPPLYCMALVALNQKLSKLGMKSMLIFMK